MNHGGIPPATSAPIIDPAEVPTTKSALPGSQSVSRATRAQAADEPRATEHASSAEHQPHLHCDALPLEASRANAGPHEST